MFKEDGDYLNKVVLLHRRGAGNARPQNIVVGNEDDLYVL
jgi:hypothetical protein